MSRATTALILAAMIIAPVCSYATDEPDELMPGRTTIVRQDELFRFTGKPPRGATFDLPGPTNDPTVEGATLDVFDTAGTAGDATYALPASGWTRLPANTARPLKGYRYKGAGSGTDPCRRVLVKAKAVTAVCKGPNVALNPPFSGEVGIILTVGTDSKRYCASFGGETVKNTDTLTKRRNAPPPLACPTPQLACNCGATTPEFVALANGAEFGTTCGTLTGGVVNNDLACNGLYFGGAQDSVPLPIRVPDFLDPQLFRATCSGTQLTLGPSTDAETGGENKQCSSQGCFFGPPLPVPNTLSTPTSTCLVNIFSADASGTLACDAGSGTINIPIFTGVHLTGDQLLNRCQGGDNPGARCPTPGPDPVNCPGGGTCTADPDVQPCPICNPTTNVCNGGPQNNQPCEPASSQAVAPQFPTSQDCPPNAILKLGDLDIVLDLTTGTDTDTAVPSGTQQRVFCGFCRDADITGNFQGPPAVSCESNAGCAQPFESCEQRNQGAFANGAATMLTETGSPAGSLTDFAAHPVTFGSVFCIPPVFDPTIDGQADLPGPGAISLRGTLQLTGAPSPSGAFLDAARQVLY